MLDSKKPLTFFGTCFGVQITLLGIAKPSATLAKIEAAQ
jgi:hypothetical protein